MPALAALLKRLAAAVESPQEGRAELRAQLERHFGRHRWVDLAPDGAGRALVIGVRRIVDRRTERGGLSDAEIDLLCEHDIAAAVQLLHDAYPWTRDLDPPRMGVLVELVMEPGLCGMAEIPGFMAAVEEGITGGAVRYGAASRLLLASPWAQRVGMGRPDELALQLVRGEWQGAA